MAGTIDEITINFTENNVQLVKEIDKVILTRGAWTTIIFKFEQWDAKKGAYGEEKFSIRRYKKSNNEYKQQSKFTISNKEQALKIIEALSKWTSSEKSII